MLWTYIVMVENRKNNKERERERDWGNKVMKIVLRELGEGKRALNAHLILKN